jgi:hypothetical protein
MSEYDLLNKLAAGLDVGLMLGKAEGRINDFAIEVVPDDMRIDVTAAVIKPLDHVMVTVALA